jgi:coenzyme F420-0:L-glutamate ligase / coenzyme F420-1:gamma-L-glutamate ligase
LIESRFAVGKSAATLQLIAVPGIPLVHHGDDLAGLILAAMSAANLALRSQDIVVIAQKIVSKAEGRLVDLATVTPSRRAIALARQVDKDPRLVEIILSESRRIIRKAQGVLIVEHRLGLIMANAGVDQSNVQGAIDGEQALLLPHDPDASAARLREDFAQRAGCNVGVIINDSFGRPWRMGTVGVAIGAAGLPALLDQRGEPDLFGRALKVTMVAYADEVAAAASLLMGQGNQGQPVIVVRGLALADAELPARVLVRPPEQDLFR